MTANMPTGVPPGVPESLITPQGNVPAIGIGTSQDYARLVYAAPYFTTVAIAEIIQPSVTEAVENVLPSLVPPYVDNAVLAGIQQYAVLLTGSTMSGPLFLNPLMPTADSQAATKAYVDTMLATAGIPEVPPVPSGQVWARETGQWVPISQTEGTFLPLSGGIMAGPINMSGNTISNMAAVPAMPNGAAPAQWVLNQIASVSLYQGTWNADTNVPDLTQLSTHINAYTWIALTTSPSGVVIGPAIPGLQGQTVFNGDTIIYSTVAGAFSAIHAGGITLPEADGRYVQLAGSQMSGALLLNANAAQPLQAVTYQQLEAAVANTVTPDAPADGQAYLRVGVGANRWVPGLPLAGGILTGALTLSGPGASGNNAVTVAQLNSAVSGVTAGLMPISGGTFTGAVILNGNATANLNPVPLQQINSMLATYVTSTQLTSALAGYLPLSGGTLTGGLLAPNLTLNGPGTALNVSVGGVSINGQTLTGTLVVNNNAQVNGNLGAVGTISSAANAAFEVTGGAYLGPFSTTGWELVDGSGAFRMVMANQNPPFNWQTGNGATTLMSLSSTGGLTISGAVNVPAAGITYTGYGSVGFATTGTTLLAATINGGALQWVVIGSIGGYQSCNELGFASNFSYAVMGQSGSLYSWTVAASDRRLKSNIRDAESDALGIVNQIAVHDLDCQMHPDVEPEHWDFSLITDEVKPHLPYAVISPPDIDGKTVYESFHTQHLISVLWRAVQQLSAKVAALEA